MFYMKMIIIDKIIYLFVIFIEYEVLFMVKIIYIKFKK